MKVEEFVQQVRLGLPKFIERLRDHRFDDTGDPDWNEEDWFQMYYNFVELNGVNPDATRNLQTEKSQAEQVQPKDEGKGTESSVGTRGRVDTALTTETIPGSEPRGRN